MVAASRCSWSLTLHCCDAQRRRPSSGSLANGGAHALSAPSTPQFSPQQAAMNGQWSPSGPLPPPFGMFMPGAMQPPMPFSQGGMMLPQCPGARCHMFSEAFFSADETSTCALPLPAFPLSGHGQCSTAQILVLSCWSLPVQGTPSRPTWRARQSHTCSRPWALFQCSCILQCRWADLGRRTHRQLGIRRQALTR